MFDARFYRSVSGSEPVRLWLERLPGDERRAVSQDIASVECGWPAGMPHYRAIAPRRALWEVRSSLGDQRLARVLLCRHGEELVLLHAFIGKSDELRERDLDLAVQRQQELDVGSQEAK